MMNEERKSQAGPVNLLLFQSTPFCNIDCRYCYLPDRNNRKVISVEVVEKTIQNLLKEKLVGRELSIGWHAGEPLAVPVSYYEKLFAHIRQIVPKEIRIRHNFQTNGVALNQQWCEFIKEHRIDIGVSIDGPAEFNDTFRKTKNQKGTFDLAMKGIGLLKKNTINFSIIAVVTGESVKYPEKLFSFFQSLGCTRVGFNIDEQEGYNAHSSLDGRSNDIIAFWNKLYELQIESQPYLMIRELEEAKRKINEAGRHQGRKYFTSLTGIYRIITVDTDGNFSTFSPELIGQKYPDYNDFVIGNVNETGFLEALEQENFRNMFAEIAGGIHKCQETCKYYSMCGGGSPVNKLYENGSFNSSETQFCRYSRQYPLNTVLGKLLEEIHR